MAIFGRRKGSTASDISLDKAAENEHEDVADSSGREDGSGEENESSELTPEEAARAQRLRSGLRPRDDVDRSQGPYDSAEAPEAERLDFGALAVPPAEGVELRLDVDDATQMITGMTAVLGADGAAAVQLQAFAAPKTSGIWYGIRREIAETLIAGGGSAEEVDGPLGTELHVRMPSQGPDGRVTFSPARFVGVDGPRWFLRAVLSGQAAVDEGVAAQALDIVRSVVVHRGSEARAPRELLELTLPPELLAQMEQEQHAGHDHAHSSERTTGPLERGPEMTETR